MKGYRKVVIAGETWSSNLGDGVIAESLQFLFKKLLPDLQIDFLDISGRNSIAPDSPKRTSSIMRFAQKVKPLYIPRVFLKWYILKSQHTPEWSAQISESDAVVIGGGQLLMDNFLDFPLKVTTIAQLSYSLGGNVHFLSCGVGSKWSRIASHLFHSALIPATSVTTRDTLSQERLGLFVPDLGVSLSADPALWTSDVYRQRQVITDNRVGLGIMYMKMLNHQSSVRLSEDELVAFWLDIIKRLHQDGIDFQLFTNGSLQDYSFASHIVRSAQKSLAISCDLAARPQKPYELAQLISRYRAIIASRLHAHIIATSYHIPSIALLWDDKVLAFFRDTGRETLVFNSFVTKDVDSVVKALYQVMDVHIDEGIVREKQELVLDNVRTILDIAGLL